MTINRPVWRDTDDGAPLQLLMSRAARGGIYTVADNSDRTALLALLSEASVAVDADNPLYVHNQSRATGLELERTTDGVTWLTIRAAAPATWVNASLSAGTGSIQYLNDNGWVTVEFNVTRAIGGGAITLTADGAIPDGSRPHLVNARGTAYAAGDPGLTSYVSTSGQVAVINTSGQNKAVVSGTIVYHV